MNTSLLSSHCIELLRVHNRVSLGSMGSFIAEDTPATLTNNGHVLMPPGRRISFRESETWNDGLLEKAYSSKEDLDALLAEVSKKLAREKSVTLDGFGKLRRTREGDVFFVVDKNVSVNPNGFGLVPLSLRPLLVPSKVRCAISAQAGDPEKAVQAGDNSPEVCTSATPEVPSMPKQAVVQTDEKVQHESIRKPRRKIPNGVMIFLLIILVLVLCLMLVYVFRDSLKPVLEKILYSAEERQLLR